MSFILLEKRHAKGALQKGFTDSISDVLNVMQKLLSKQIQGIAIIWLNMAPK